MHAVSACVNAEAAVARAIRHSSTLHHSPEKFASHFIGGVRVRGSGGAHESEDGGGTKHQTRMCFKTNARRDVRARHAARRGQRDADMQRKGASPVGSSGGQTREPGYL